MSGAGAREMHVLAVGKPWVGRGDEVARALGEVDLARAEILKLEGGDSVVACTILGRATVVKVQGPRGIVGTIKRYLGLSRAWRQWRGAATLARLSIATAQPLALAIEIGTGREWFVADRLIGPTLLHELAGKGMGARPAVQHEIAEAVGRQVGAMVRAGHFNRDHKPSNIVLTADGPAVIDTVAIRQCRDGSREAAARMLASLVIEPTGCGFPARLALRARCVAAAASVLEGAGAERASRRELWSLAREIIRDHGDMRPRVSPLG